MSAPEVAALRDVLAELTAEQTATLVSYMAACEPGALEAALAYVHHR
ncbi:hypothetical protein [Spongiactinospora sp. TRM90649]|nr:hypothetical protein [Spongiactinospora sp. TRM90649]MDF5759187.1 hypothetical protein [Spongiactinospora sp. TRM90649]